MSAVLTRHAEQREAAAALAALANEERAAYVAYMTAPAGAEDDFSADGPHMRWHRALDAWGQAIVAYRQQYGDTGDSGTVTQLASRGAVSSVTAGE